MTADGLRERPLLVFDVGKTNLKLSLVAPDGQVQHEVRQANAAHAGPPYPHCDVAAIWAWLLEQIAGLPGRERIGAVIATTHGATFAAVDAQALVLPVMDYEFEGLSAVDAEYAALRDDFASTCSPALPAGLNAGKQLYWLARRHGAAFARAHRLLPYPQYWAWRLCGVMASEITSLGCHTDLWSPATRDFAPLVDRLGWRRLFAPLRPAGAALGVLRAEVAQCTGLPVDCRVLCGIHDSNASLVPHLYGRSEGAPLSVISSGTWTIVAGIGVPLAVLDPQRDMLANVDAWGRPFPCARFMGGREFARLNAGGAMDCADEDLAALLAAGTMALPSFAHIGGPYRDQTGRIAGPPPATPQAHYALATLYCALMSDDALQRLGAAGDIVVEGSLTSNRHFAPLLAALRPRQTVRVAQDRSGTSSGAWLLAHAPATQYSARQQVAPAALPALGGYRARWRARLAVREALA